MAIDGKALKSLGAGIDQPQAMNFAAGEGELGDARVGCAFEIKWLVKCTNRDTGGKLTCWTTRWNETAVVAHFTVDEIVIRERRWARRLKHGVRSV